jgi:hypothetical protein
MVYERSVYARCIDLCTRSFECERCRCVALCSALRAVGGARTEVRRDRPGERGAAPPERGRSKVGDESRTEASAGDASPARTQGDADRADVDGRDFLQPFQAILISVVLLAITAALGMRTLSIPSLKSARMRDASTFSGRVKARVKAP